MQNIFPGPATLQCTQRINGTCSSFEQVQLFTGNFQAQVSIVSVPSVGPSLEFSLFYNALDSDNLTEVGYGWRHNHMMQLLLSGDPINYVTLVSETGRQYGYYKSTVTNEWLPDTDTNNPSGNHYNYFPGDLIESGPNWVIAMPGGTNYAFATAESVANLTSVNDAYANSLTLHYTSQLDSIEDATGRVISLNYADGGLASITDPNGNTTLLSYDDSNNLTQITGAIGCIHSYDYADATNVHLLTSHTDPRMGVYVYTYNSDKKIHTARDSESTSYHTLTYMYDTIKEVIDGSGTTGMFNRTTLTDANGKIWQYRFDYAGNLKRIVTPLGNRRSYISDTNQRTLFSASGNPYQPFIDTDTSEPLDGPYSGPNNICSHAYTDSAGNLQSTKDPAGLITMPMKQWSF